MTFLNLLAIGLLGAALVYYGVVLERWRRMIRRDGASHDDYHDSPAVRNLPVLLLAAIIAGALNTLSHL